jgi:nicotinate phosphoribosyltransferase
VWLAANKGPVMEFGLRRAQGADGAMSASRAAYLGGAAGTSNASAGKRYGIPVMGTMAHSWVMSFPNEEAAFDAYAETFPTSPCS